MSAAHLELLLRLGESLLCQGGVVVVQEVVGLVEQLVALQTSELGGTHKHTHTQFKVKQFLSRDSKSNLVDT